MKLITLNIWGGHIKQPLLNFIKNNSDIDIFCLQEAYQNANAKISTDDREVHLNIFSEISDLLPEHKAFFKPVVGNSYGIGVLASNKINIMSEGDMIIHDNPHYHGSGPTHSRNLQWLECAINRKVYYIVNVHGLWNGKGKYDSPERINQSNRIKSFLNNIQVPTIICGDFNLRPDTESLSIISKGMNNLIMDYDIKSTRTSLYSKDEKFADYIFTSPDVQINSFKVMTDEISDHLPLLLDFN